MNESIVRFLLIIHNDCRQNLFFVLAFAVLLSGCRQEVRKAAETMHPERVPATGYIVPEELLKAPVVTAAGKPRVVNVSHKSDVPGKLFSQLAGKPQIIKLLDPVVKTPGENGLSSPKIIRAIKNPVLCKSPKMILVRDANSRDINPQNFSNYSVLQGLRSDQVRSMVQDKKGNLWLGTDDGLTKYDGRYFFHYTTDQGLKNSLILWVFIDSHENIWFGTYGGGVTMYDGRSLLNFTTREGLVDNYVNCIYEDTAGNMWIGTTNGVSRYDGISFTNYTDSEGLCGNFIRNFTQDKEGKIWIASDKSGLSVFDGKSFLNYSRKEGLIDNSIYFFFRDTNDDIWLGAGSTHLLKFDGKNFLHYPLSGGSGNNYIRTIISDDKGNMWIGTEEEGLLVFDGNTFTHYTDKEGLSSNLIRCSLKDKNGKLWFGTRGGGITRYDGDLFTHLSMEEGLSNNRVMAILEDQPDQFWIGTYGGYVTRSTYREINGLKKRFFSYYNEKDGLPNGRIYTITRDNNNNIWFGTDGGGISVFNGKSMATYTSGEGLCGDAVRKIIQDSKGNLWIASHNSGISKFDGNSFVNYTVKQGLSSDYVLSIMEDKEGNLWMGTTNAGITMFDGKKFTHFTEDNGFFNNMVYCIMQDKNGIIWFGTGGGAISYDGKFFTRYRNINGNDFVNVLSILQDSRDNIWFGTRSGLFILKEGKTDNPQFRRFNYEDGFGGIGCNMGAITESEDGTIWIGTTDRLTAYHREGDKSNQGSISVQLTGVNLFNETIPWGDIFGKNDTIITLSNGVPIRGFRFRDISPWNNIPVDLNLWYNNNYLTFNYVAVSVTGNSKIRYQYKLDGYEGDWSIPTETTEVSFGNLNHGSYIFRVRAIDRNGISSDEVSYPFVIRPPWYKTIAFRILLVTTIVVLILSYIQYRLRKLQRDKEILQQKVDEQTSEITRNNLILTMQKNEILEKNIAIEKTNEELVKINSEKDKFFSIIAHDLRGPFSGLMMLTEEMTAQINELDKEEIKEMLKAMQTSSTNLFRLLENLLNWARMKRGKIPFEPDNYALYQVVNESLSLMMDQALAKKIEIELRIPSDIFVFADKNMLQTIIRNLVSNAIKFTHTSGRVFLSADRYEKGLIVISVKDTGIGMSSDLASRIFRIDEKINRSGTEGEISTGLGLLLCKEFVEKHGGAIWVDSVEGKGSEFRFSIQEGRTK